MFVAMNRFQVNPERAEEFERGWRERDSRLRGWRASGHSRCCEAIRGASTSRTRSGTRAKRFVHGCSRSSFVRPMLKARLTVCSPGARKPRSTRRCSWNLPPDRRGNPGEPDPQPGRHYVRSTFLIAAVKIAAEATGTQVTEP